MRKVVLLAVPVCRNNRLGYLVLSKPPVQPSESGHLQTLQNTMKKAERLYHTWKKSDSNGIRYKTIAIFEKLKSFLDPHEMIASDIANSLIEKHSKTQKPFTNIEIVFPSSLDSNFIKSSFKETMEKKKNLNTQYLIGYTAITPFTSAAAVLPGPNIFFYANAARLYSLYKARQAFGQINSILNNDNPTNIDDNNSNDMPIIHYTANDDEDLNWIQSYNEKEVPALNEEIMIRLYNNLYMDLHVCHFDDDNDIGNINVNSIDKNKDEDEDDDYDVESTESNSGKTQKQFLSTLNNFVQYHTST